MRRRREVSHRLIPGELARAIFKGSSAALVARLVSAPANLLLSALMIRDLGAQRYGGLAVALSVLSLVPFADLGIGSALVSQIAEAHQAQDAQKIRSLWTRGRGAIRIPAIVLVAAGIACIVIGERHQTDVISLPATGALIAVVGATLPAAMGQRVLLGMQRTDLFSYANIASCLCAVVATLAALHFHAPLWTVALAWHLQLSLGTLVCTAIARRMLTRSEVTNPHEVGGVPSALLRTGLAYVVISSATAITYETDELVISTIRGPRSVASYDMHARLFGSVVTTAVTLLSPIWPAASAAASTGRIDWLRRLARRSVVVTTLATAGASVICFLISEPFVRALSGGRVSYSPLLAASFAAWAVSMSLSACLASLLSGVRLVRTQLCLTLLALVINLGLAIPATLGIGASGPVLGTVAAQVFFSVGAFTRLRRSLGALQQDVIPSESR